MSIPSNCEFFYDNEFDILVVATHYVLLHSNSLLRHSQFENGAAHLWNQCSFQECLLLAAQFWNEQIPALLGTFIHVGDVFRTQFYSCCARRIFVILYVSECSVQRRHLKGTSSLRTYYFSILLFTIVLSQWDFFHGKFRLPSLGKASCDRVMLPNLWCMLGVLVSP